MLKQMQSAWQKLLVAWWRLAVPVALRQDGMEVDARVKFYGFPVVSLVPGSHVRIAERSVLCSDSRFTALGVSKPVVLRTLRRGALIDVGRDTGMSGTTVCAAVSVRIGSACLIGADVMIVDNDFHPIRPEGRRYNRNEEDIPARPVVIEDNVFIGARAIVMKGVTIGRNSVIGAGAVVVSDVPENSIAVGTPARVVGNLRGSE